MADRYYTLHIAGCTRNLPILNVTDKLAIAGFVMLGDVELTDACAQALAKKVPPETDYVLTAETKGIPLAEELARALGMDRYIVARKSVKAYMENALWVDDVSITTKGTQKLCLDGTDIERIKGKNVLLRLSRFEFLADAVFRQGVEQDVGDLVEGTLLLSDGLCPIVIMDIMDIAHLW